MKKILFFCFFMLTASSDVAFLAFETHLKQADIVAVGTLVSSTKTKDGVIHATFSINKFYKGNNIKTVVVSFDVNQKSHMGCKNPSSSEECFPLFHGNINSKSLPLGQYFIFGKFSHFLDSKVDECWDAIKMNCHIKIKGYSGGLYLMSLENGEKWLKPIVGGGTLPENGLAYMPEGCSPLQCLPSEQKIPLKVPNYTREIEEKIDWYHFSRNIIYRWNAFERAIVTALSK